MIEPNAGLKEVVGIAIGRLHALEDYVRKETDEISTILYGIVGYVEVPHTTAPVDGAADGDL